MLISSTTWPALLTTPYIAFHSKPLYAHRSAMPYANPQAIKGGYLSRAVAGTFDNLNAMNGQGSYVEASSYLFDSLMVNSLDESGVMYPLLAEKISYDPKQTNFVIFHLNPKAKFSNGRPVTAADVKFSFDTFKTKSNPGLQTYLADLKHTVVLSRYQVKIIFNSDRNIEMSAVLASMPIYSKQDWQQRDFTRISLQPILGSGPYLIDKIDPGRSIRYKRNPDYWGKNLPVNQGKYNFNYIQYRYYRDLAIAFEAFKSGQVTFYEENLAGQWVNGYRFPAVQAGMVKQLEFKHHNPIPTQSFIFNTRRTPFNDIRFRQAISYVYDFEWQNKALFFGKYQRLQSFFSNSELEAKAKPSAAEMAILRPYLPQLNAIQRHGVLSDWRYPVSDASGFNRAGLLKARELLLKAGYRYQNGQLLNLKGQPIRIEFLIHQQSLTRTLMPFVRNMQRLGIKMTIRQVDFPQYIERKSHFDFDMTTDIMPQSLSPGNEQAQFWGSAAANQPLNYNYAGIQNPVIDAVIQLVIQAPNRQQLVLRTRVLDRLLRAGYYQIPTYGKGGDWYAYWNMYRWPKIQPKLSLGIDYWWSDAQQAQKVAQYLRQH
ncbi:extracellular solute-binding protein [Acinetobacter sp. SAAs470]|nr:MULTISPECIES: extracellular solute-binding protein [unclassified Acinetobacter]WOE33042.1 extracellular solute-binding protein [Acinetobacter sp. SAAs470]WOE39875.1 extracellular solute-binding protein [Acinetobacter sp. SAAs474]